MTRSSSCIISSSRWSARSEMLCGLVCWFMASPLCARLRDGFDGVDDRLIAGAAAVVPGKMFADGITARGAVVRQQLLRGQKHARRAKAALQGVAAAEGFLQVGYRAGIRHALDCLDLCTVALHRQSQTAPNHRAIEHHR